MPTAKRKAKPWRITWFTDGDPKITEYTSQRAAYDAVNAERRLCAKGASIVRRIRVEHWESGKWVLFEWPSLDEMAI